MSQKAKKYLDLIQKHMHGNCPDDSSCTILLNGAENVTTHNKFYVKNSSEAMELTKAFKYLFEQNAVHYIKRIIIGNPPDTTEEYASV